MDRTGAISADRLKMLARPVPFVLLETVLRPFLGILLHQEVAAHLGNVRGGGDRLRLAVPSHDFLAENLGVVKLHPVDQQAVRPFGKLLHSFEHGDDGRLIDVDPVDLFGGDNPDTIPNPLLCGKVAVEGQTLSCRKLFTIVYALNMDVVRNDAGGRDNGTGKRTSSRLVDASYPSIAFRSRFPFIKRQLL